MDVGVMQRKVVGGRVEIKATGGAVGAGTIKGYAAVFNNVDRDGDLILPGAFQKGLKRFLKDGFIAYGHDHSALPVAIPTAAYEDEYGLVFEGDVHSTQAAQDARTIAAERTAAGKTVSFSVGYMVPPSGMKYRDDGVREISEMELFEVSFANIPANPKALLLGVKEGSIDGSSSSDLSFSEHSDAVVSAVEEYLERARGRQTIRTKEGRRISAATRAKLQTIAKMVEELLAEDERSRVSDTGEPTQASGIGEDEPKEKLPAVPLLEAEALKQREVERQAPPPPNKKRAASVIPGAPGTLEYYRCQLAQIEHFAIQNGVAMPVTAAVAAPREGR